MILDSFTKNMSYLVADFKSLRFNFFLSIRNKNEDNYERIIVRTI